jgi:hypothetical protein
MGKVQKYTIVKDRVGIYQDFALNLLYYINYYYIDYESINTDEDIDNHYNWCFNKVCDEFLLEELNFRENNSVRMYFKSYYYNFFYKPNINQDTSLVYYEKFWRAIFDIENQKNNKLINVLIEIYLIFDESINNKKNILEIA